MPYLGVGHVEPAGSCDCCGGIVDDPEYCAHSGGGGTYGNWCDGSHPRRLCFELSGYDHANYLGPPTTCPGDANFSHAAVNAAVNTRHLSTEDCTSYFTTVVYNVFSSEPGGANCRIEMKAALYGCAQGPTLQRYTHWSLHVYFRHYYGFVQGGDNRPYNAYYIARGLHREGATYTPYGPITLPGEPAPYTTYPSDGPGYCHEVVCSPGRKMAFTDFVRVPQDPDLHPDEGIAYPATLPGFAVVVSPYACDLLPPGGGLMMAGAMPMAQVEASGERGPCHHLGRRTEFRDGCGGRMCRHDCTHPGRAADHPDAVPGGNCQTCPDYEAG